MTERTIKANLYDPRQGDRAVRTQDFVLDGEPSDRSRTNYFSIYFIERGSGTFWADTSHFEFGPDSLLFFVPYQHVRFIPSEPVHGQLLQFHANFLCVETFHAEVGCSGILFNDPYGAPLVSLDNQTKREATNLLERIQTEQSNGELAFSEVMLAYLKVLLILAARLKSPTSDACAAGVNDPRHPVLIQLRELIEQNYCTMHAPAEYARQLHVTAKTLGRIVREQLGTTPTDLIRNRILIHAKWQLLHTLKPVKEIARELGFGDELYFSRLFKKATGISPTFFRDFETEIRGGSNLSMFSSQAPILHAAAPSDT
jgi:AraC-like DNA-binding protein